jgi:translocation and assembly module TamB
MSGTGANPRRHRFWKSLLAGAAFLLLLLGLAIWYTTTSSFQAVVRQRLVSKLESVTGGRVELGGIHTIPFRFQVEVRDLTIHGRETAGEVPYVHVDSVVARVKVISVLGVEMGFRSLVLDHPVVHIVWYPDGSTNQPEPRKVRASAGAAKLFALSVDSLEVRRGELLWKDEKIPLDFVVKDVSASLDYSFLHRRYDGSLLLGKVDTALKDYRPFAWMTEVHFTLSHNSLEIKSLKASSGRSSIEARGRVENFQEPKAEGGYSVSVDLAEAAAIVRGLQMRRGIVLAEGNGSWNQREFSTVGKLKVKDFEWRDDTVKLNNVSGSSDFSASSQRLTLSHLQAKLVGGNVGGDADIFNWLGAASTRNDTLKTSNQPRSTVRLRVKDVSVAEIATALSSAGRPFDRANFAGVAGGSVETRWRGNLRSAETDITLDVAPPAQAKPGQLPLNAHGHAIYDSARDELRVEEFEASTRATQVRAAGTLSGRTTMKLSVITTDLEEWQPVLAALGYYEPVPVRLRGSASFRGTASGKLSDVMFSGNLQSRDFDILPAGAKEIDWDGAAADIQLSPHIFALHHGTLHSGSTTISFDFNAGLQERGFTNSSPFTARVEMRDADASKILALTGLNYPFSGRMNLWLRVSGTRAAPAGQGEIELSRAVIYGRPVQAFQAKLVFAGPQIDLSDLRATQGDALVLGSAAYNEATHAFRFNLNGSNFDLARVSQLQYRRWNVGGRLDFNTQGSGTLDSPQVNARIQVRDLALDQERMGDFTFDAVTQGSELRLTGRSQFHASELDVEGNVHLRGDWPATVSLHFNQLDVSTLLPTYIKQKMTGTSLVAGDLQLQGPLGKRRDLAVTGNLSSLSTEVQHVQVRNNGPIRFAISGQSLRLQKSRFVGEDTDLALEGTLQLTGDQRLELRADGHANLKLIHSFDPAFTTSGAVAVDLVASGPFAKPVLQGRLQITDGAIAYADLPSALSGINGSLVLNQDRLQIETLTARTGGGSVSVGGYANLYNRQLNFDLTLRTQDVRLRYPPGVSSITNAQLRFAGTPAASTLSGDITITKLAITPGFDFGSYLQRTAQTSVLPQTDPVLSRIRLDVHFGTTPELQMQTAVVRLSGDADLRLRGTAAKPVLLGRADILEGQVYVNGAKYRMERGEVTFSNPVTTTPVLDLQATTRVRDYDISVNLNGEVDKLNLSYHSEPPLPTAAIISLLALGQTQQQSAQMQSVQSPFAEQASSAVLAEALNSAVSNRSQRLFGISHIKIDPQGLNTETAPTQTTPAVTIEQQVRDNLTITYTTNVSQTSQQIIQGEYNLTRDLSILGIRDYNGVVSFEVRLRRRRR